MKTLFVRAIEAGDKAALIRDVVRSAENHRPERFELDVTAFSIIPGSPFAYWASDDLRRVFSAFAPFATGQNTVKQGLASGDDFRFMRLWWEVDARAIVSGDRWVPVSKGGESRPYYADLPLIIGYSRAEQVAIQQIGRFGRGATHYYLRGLTYPLRASRFSPQALPEGVITTVRGSGIYAYPHPAPFLAILNSSTVDYLLKLSLGRGGHPQFDMGDIAAVPIPPISPNVARDFAKLGVKAWAATREPDTANETSHAFVMPALLAAAGKTLSERVAERREYLLGLERVLTTLQEEIDARCFDLYGITAFDRRAIAEGFGITTINSESAPEAACDRTEVSNLLFCDSLVCELLSWAIGVAFGRFDVRVVLVTGEPPVPLTSDPFKALPVCAPGVLTDSTGLPVSSLPNDYPIAFAVDGVLVDDDAHSCDVTTAVRAVFGVLNPRFSDDWWNEAAELATPRSDIQHWLATRFFGFHLSAYSRNGRQAPVYWQLAPPSASYSVWLYAHRLTRDSFFQIQKDIVGPKLTHEENELARFLRDGGPAPTAEQRKSIASQEAFVAELRAFRDEIARVAPLWNPNLDDGVVITSAPLWRLFPHHKAWQKELKGYWDELCAGKYNWSHLAMHLWPERVVPNCATDRSIAIAHDLEEVFWVEDAKGKWKERTKPTRPIEELVAERTSPAVKAALQALIEAPVAAGAGTKRRSRRT